MVGYYAIPVADQQVFQQVDGAGFRLYQEQLLRNTSTLNPNEIIGIVCAKCPVGADCSLEGTNISSVQAADGYFKGLDDTGTYFSLCLNEACLRGGNCSDGYTGTLCTECDNTQSEVQVVLSKGFACTECPPLELAVLVMTLALLVVVGLLAYRLRQTRNKKAGPRL